MSWIKKDGARDFAYFKKKSDCLRDLQENPLVDDETICFISDDKTIYTHKSEFGGGSTYTAGDYISIVNNSISVDYSSLKNKLTQDGIGSTNTNYAITNLSVANGKLHLEQNPNVTKEVTLTLNSLSDVMASDPTNGSVLKYYNGVWSPGTDNTGAGGGITPGQTQYVYIGGVTADMNPNSIIVSKKEDGTNFNISCTTLLYAYNQGQKVPIDDIQFVEATGNSGTPMTEIVTSEYFTYGTGNGNAKVITINIPEGRINYNDFGNVIKLQFNTSTTINGAQISSPAYFNIYVLDESGLVQNGKNGVSYRIVVPSAVKSDANQFGTITPSSITPYVEICTSTGQSIDNIAENTQKIYASDITGDYKLCVKFDDGSWELIPTSTNAFTTNNLQNFPKVRNTIRVALVKDHDTENPIAIGLEEIPVIQTGANGLNADGITYELQPVMSTVAKHQDSITGQIGVKLFILQNGSRQEVKNNISDLDLEIQGFLGVDRELISFEYNEQLDYHKASVNAEWSEQNSFIEIIVYSFGDVEQVASIIIPVRVDGESVVQSLDYDVMRMRGSWVENPDPAYNNGSVIEDGVKYTDIVEYGNNYFRCTVAGTLNPPVDLDTFTGDGSQVNQGWSVFQYAPDTIYQYLIAKNAFIQSLTAKQITITNNNNEIVAGMADGEFINNSAELSDNSTNGIRIWAGPLGSGGNVAAAPFTVDEQGHLKAMDAEIISGDSRNGVRILNIDGQELGDIELQGTTWPVIQMIHDNKCIFNIGMPVGHNYASGVTGVMNNVIYADGSGELAGGSIRWNASGDLTINGTLQIGSRKLEIVSSNLSSQVYFNVGSDSVQGTITITNSNNFDVYVTVGWWADGMNSYWNAHSVSEVLFIPRNSSKDWTGSDNVNTGNVSIDIQNSYAEIMNAYHYID